MPNQRLKQEKNDKNHQDPQGILIQNNKLYQDSQGILKEEVSRCLISTKEYRQVKFKEIIPYAGILDYIEPKPSAFPTIVKTPSQYYCIDGQYLIQKAIEDKKTFELCHIIHINTESEFEIAIQKATIRCISDEGMPAFAELVRNCRQLLLIFLDTTENPVFYSHGGKRKDIQYDPANRENNIRVLLADRFGKSLSTINKYINYSEYLDEGTLDRIVHSKVGKKYFEEVASNKRRLIKNLKSENKDDDFITEKVSEYMAYWLQEWCEGDKKKIVPLSFESNVIPSKKRCLINLPKTFEHHGEVECTEEELPEQQLRQELQSIGLAIYTNLNDEEYGTDESIEQLKHNFSQILTLTNKLRIMTEVA